MNARMKIPIGAQSGAVIHHQDQLITLVSFNTRNVMNNRPKKPFPPTIVVFSFDISLLFLSVIVNRAPEQIYGSNYQNKPNNG